MLDGCCTNTSLHPCETSLPCKVSRAVQSYVGTGGLKIWVKIGRPNHQSSNSKDRGMRDPDASVVASSFSFSLKR